MASVPPQGGRKHPQQELIQIDTTNILFICGGAFDGLDKIIESRIDQSSIGFGAEIKEKLDTNVGEMFKKAVPQDLMKFGLIPEFVGRVPIVVSLDNLDTEAMIRILKEPKNSLIKQYTKLFELDGVELTFSEEAIREIAEKTMRLETGARGLRSIMEEAMMDLMYKIPSDESIEACRITKELIEGTGKAEIVYGEVSQKAMKSA